MSRLTRASEVRRFLRTGDHDMLFEAWPGSNLVECARAGSEDWVNALLEEVARRTARRPAPTPIPGVDSVAFARRKVEPMVRGLFPRGEQGAVLDCLERSIVFLTPDRIEAVLRGRSFPRSAWTIANLYLLSRGAELLSGKAPRIVGMSEETTCFVSVAYFSGEESPFADFLVHEAAHVFHNCKRETIGLRATRRREWLLEIDFGQRETFAYACEAYSRILERAARPSDRRALAEEAASVAPPDGSVDHGEYASILREAAGARNGWKRILARCSPDAQPSPRGAPRVDRFGTATNRS